MTNNPLHSLAIPIRWNRPLSFTAWPSSRKRRWKLAWISPDQLVGANRHGVETFGVVTTGQARHSERPCLLGNASRIGNDTFAILHQIIELLVNQQFDTTIQHLNE